MEAYYLYLKTIHLIFSALWFLGLVSSAYLFVQQLEVSQKPMPENRILSDAFKKISNFLWKKIARPSMILSFFFGIWLVSYRSFYLSDGWMQIKLGFVFLLILIHLQYERIFKKLQSDEIAYTPAGMKLFNVFPLLVFIFLTFLSVLRHGINWIYGSLIFIVLIIVVFRIKKIFNKKNFKRKNKN